MTVLSSTVYDNGLSVLAGADGQQICSQEPATFTEATSTYKLGSNTPSAGSPGAGSPDGRQVTVAAVTSGSVSASGTATHHSLTKTTGSVLLAAKSLSASQAVTNGNTYSLTSYTIRIPAAV